MVDSHSRFLIWLNGHQPIVPIQGLVASAETEKEARSYVAAMKRFLDPRQVSEIWITDTQERKRIDAIPLV